MFHRGQKVQIIESKCQGKLRPQVGDVGYLNNMFLFPRDRFILTDIFFFSFKHRLRIPERKKFIIDLGMDKHIKNQICLKGVNKQFFVMRPHVCINPTVIFLDKVLKVPRKIWLGKLSLNENIHGVELVMPQLVGTYGIWNGYTSLIKPGHQPKKPRNKLVDNNFRVPCGQLKSLFTPKLRYATSKDETSAWLQSVFPIVFVMTNALPNFFPANESVGQKAYKLAMDAYGSIAGDFINYTQNDKVILYSIYKTVLRDGFSPSRVDQYTTILNWLITLHNHLICKLEDRSLHYILNGLDTKKPAHTLLVKTFRKQLLNDNISNNLDLELIPKKDNSAIKADLISMTNIFLRTIFGDYDTKKGLDKMLIWLPQEWNISSLTKAIEQAKSDAMNSSASLARIFEELKEQPNKKGGTPCELDLLENFFEKHVSDEF